MRKLIINFVKNSIAFCQNKAIPNKIISLNLSVTSPVIRRIPMFYIFNRVMDSNEIDTDDTEYDEDIYPYLEVNLGPADIRPYMFEPAPRVAQCQSGSDSGSSGSEREIEDTNPERIGNTDW